MAQQVEAIANTLLELGRINGQGAANQGQIWGNTLAGLGQIPQQIQQGQAQQQNMQLRQQEMQIRQTQVDQAQRQQQTEALWNNAIANSLTPDNNIDFEKLAPVVKQNPALIPHWQGLQSAMLDTQEKGAKVLEAQSKLEEAQAAHASALANAADAAPDPETKAATLLVGLVQGGQKKSIDPQYAKQTVSRLLSASGAPDPANVATVIAQMKQLSAADLEKRGAAAEKFAAAAKAGAPGQPRPITNEIEAALVAEGVQPGQAPTAEQAGRALTRVKPPKAEGQTNEFQDFKAAYAKSVGGPQATWETLPPALQLRGITQYAQKSRDPGMASIATEMAKARLDELRGTGPKAQEGMEQKYAASLQRVAANRSGGLGLEDQKVNQAAHLLALLDQSKDKDGNYQVPRVIQTELALGLARLTAGSGQVGAQLEGEINQHTLKGDFAGALTYLTGQPVTGNTQAIFKMYRDSIERQGRVAEQNRTNYLKMAQEMAPSDLDPARRTNVEKGLGFLTSVTPGGATPKNSTAPAVGDIRMLKGHRVKITKVNPDGTVDYETQ